MFPADLVKFAEETLNGELHFCAVLAKVYLFNVNNKTVEKSAKHVQS